MRFLDIFYNFPNRAFKRDFDYTEYEEKLSVWNIGEKSLFDNEDICCAEIVTRKIFENAKADEVKPVYMLCQNFSLFRDSTKKAFKIRNLESFFNGTQIALLDYLSTEGSNMTVYTENDVRNLTKESIWNDTDGKHGLGCYVKNGRIQFRYITIPLSLSHFMVAGDSFRSEKSEKDKTAICGENHKLAETLKYFADYCNKYSRPIAF